MNHFEPVNVSLMFQVPAEGVESRRTQEVEDREKQEQDGKRSPVVHSSQTPARTPTFKRPFRTPVAQVQTQKDNKTRKCNSLPDMSENVVTHFVPKHRERL